MRRRNNFEKNKMIIGLCLLLALGIGLGYAVLTEQLKLTGSANYNAMAWEVGFSEASDGNGSVLAVPTISPDKKTISVTCDLGTSTKAETCIAKATIKNDSTFDVELITEPLVTFNATYIDTVDILWSSDSAKVDALDKVESLKTRELLIKIVTKQLSEDLLPEEELNIPVSVTMNWIEAGATNSDALLAGKSALFIGDSVQYGQGNSGKGWSYYIEEEYALDTVKKVAVSGSSFTKNSSGTDRIINQFKNLTGEYDFVILEGGINDLTYGSTWGTVSNDYTIVNNSTIIVEAIEETIHTMLTKYPNSKVGYILLYNTEDSGRSGHDTQLDAYHELILSIFNKWNIPVFDMYSGSVMYEGEQVTFDELLDVHNTTYLSDGLHLNDAGYQLTYKYIGEWMKTLTTVSLPNTDNDNGGSEPDTPDEPTEEETGTVTFSGVTYNTTNLISGLEWTRGYQLSQGALSYNEASGKTGRVASVGYLLKVDGGETITISQGDTYNFAIYEVNSNGSLSGAKADSWINNSVTLNTNTRYVGIYLKRVDEVDWTDSEINNISNTLTIE